MPTTLHNWTKFHDRNAAQFSAAQPEQCTDTPMKSETLIRIGFLALLAVIFVMANMPGNDAPSVFSYDKLNHMLAFFVLSVGATIAWPRANPLVAVALLSIYGGAIELSQWVMNLGRQADWRDIAANSVAIALGMITGYTFNVIRRRIERCRKT
ncbi:VanZ family protein [Qipengyuania sp. 483]